MQADVFLVIGMVLGLLAFPTLLNAYSESRFPRMALVLFLLAAGLITLAVQTSPTGYAIDDIPDVFIRVIARLLP